MNIFQFIKKLFQKKYKLKTFVCRKHRHDLLLRSSRQYIQYYSSKGIYIKICYNFLEESVHNLIIQEINNNFNKDEIKILNNEKCVYDNKILLDKIMTLENIAINKIIKHDEKFLLN